MNIAANKSLVVYWIATALLSVAFVGMGISNVVQPGTMSEDIAKSGYPSHFFKFLGFCQTIGGLVILLPRLARWKEWAYAGIFVNMIAASHHHVMAGDDAVRIGSPLIIMSIAVVSYVLRPPSRRIFATVQLS